MTTENNHRETELRSIHVMALPTIGPRALDLTTTHNRVEQESAEANANVDHLAGQRDTPANDTCPPPAAAPPDPTASETAKPHADGADVVEQIRKLGELRDAGLLTADRFEAKKIDLLSRLWR